MNPWEILPDVWKSTRCRGRLHRCCSPGCGRSPRREAFYHGDAGTQPPYIAGED